MPSERPESSLPPAGSQADRPRLARLARAAREVGARFRLHPVQNVIVVVLVSVAVVGLGVVISLVSATPTTSPNKPALADPLAELDAGRYERARQVAADLRVAGHIPTSGSGVPAFVLGMAAAHDAQRRPADRERQFLFLLAARYLEEALAAELPGDRRQTADWELGRCLFESGRYSEAIPALESALRTCPEQASEICRRLAAAFLRLARPDPKRALEYSEQYLRTADVSPAERETALLVQSRMLMEQGEIDRCRSCLEQVLAISPRSAEARLLLGWLTLLEADRLAAGEPADRDAMAAKYAAARDVFREIRGTTDSNSDVDRQAQFLMVLACRRLGASSEALTIASSLARTAFDTPEGMAASLEEAELHAALGHPDEALDAYRQVLRQAGEKDLYSNPWVSLAELQRRLGHALDHWLQNGQWDQAIGLAQAFTPLLGTEKSVQGQTAAHEAWAQQLQQQAAGLAGEEREALLASSRAAWRKAGDLQRDLARLRLASPAYPDVLWAAAQDYLRGEAYPDAIQTLRMFLADVERRRAPPALTALGDALLALGKPDEALLPLNECLEFHTGDPVSYRARLIAAQAKLELDKTEDAKQLLLQNLEQTSLTPRSVEWRESLNQLGRIFYREGLEHELQARSAGLHSRDEPSAKKALGHLELAQASYQEALRRLNEVVARCAADTADSNAEEILESRYLAAEALRRSALLPLKKLPGVTIESLRARLTRQAQQELAGALRAFSELQQRLSEKQDRRELSELEQRMLRNCYFARAAILFDMGRYEDALLAYQAATNRYQRYPEAVEAYVQIAHCLRRLDRPKEARGTLEQAKVVLRQIPAEADFTRTTCYDRTEWGQVLDWLAEM